MTYLSGKAYKKKTYYKYIVLAVLFFGVVFFWSPVKKGGYGFLEPVVIKFASVKNSFGFFPEFFATYVTSHRSLAERNRVLEKEIEQLENIVAERDSFIKEMTETFGATIKNEDKLTLVTYPLMQDITKVYSTVLLSKGFKDGVEVGNSVFLRGNQIVCTIKEVYTSSSLCLLFSSSGVVTEGVTSSSSVVVSLVGRGGHYVADVVRDTQIEKGEKVYLRSNPSMVLGTVKEVINNDQDTSWHVFVEGAYNPVTSSVFYVRP